MITLYLIVGLIVLGDGLKNGDVYIDETKTYDLLIKSVLWPVYLVIGFLAKKY